MPKETNETNFTYINGETQEFADELCKPDPQTFLQGMSVIKANTKRVPANHVQPKVVQSPVDDDDETGEDEAGN